MDGDTPSIDHIKALAWGLGALVSGSVIFWALYSWFLNRVDERIKGALKNGMRDAIRSEFKSELTAAFTRHEQEEDARINARMKEIHELLRILVGRDRA